MGRKSLRMLFHFGFIGGVAWYQPALAQSVSGMTGVVTDSSGSCRTRGHRKAGAASVGLVKETVTNEDGSFEFRSIQSGAGYRLTFKKASFKAATLENLTLAVTEIATFNAVLELGEVSQICRSLRRIRGALNTTDASIGNDIDTRRVAELPSLFRTNAAALLLWPPGSSLLRTMVASRIARKVPSRVRAPIKATSLSTAWTSMTRPSARLLRRSARRPSIPSRKSTSTSASPTPISAAAVAARSAWSPRAARTTGMAPRTNTIATQFSRPMISSTIRPALTARR